MPPPAPPDQPVEAADVPRRIAARALAWLVAPTALAAVLVLVLRGSHPEVAHGLLVGHLAAQAVTLTWLLGALATFGAPFKVFLGATIGLAPLRFALALVALVLLVTVLPLDPTATVLSFVATHVVGQVIEAATFSALARSARPPEPRDPSPAEPPSGAAEPPQHDETSTPPDPEPAASDGDPPARADGG